MILFRHFVCRRKIFIEMCCFFFATFLSLSYVEIFKGLFEGISWIVTGLDLSIQNKTQKTTTYKPKTYDMLISSLQNTVL